jgi:cobalt-precorrin-5B (C1)-methyltransferase
MTTLRTGITTGACAAAAAKAATMVLVGQAAPERVNLVLPDRQVIEVPILYARPAGPGGRAVAAVRKDAGDDPDVTDGLVIVVTVWPAGGPQGSPGITETEFFAGEGVGTVTKPGLQVPPGQPAINPVPRRMIAAAIAEVTSQPLAVEVAIPGGRQVAARTFNPRLGIVGGLSVLGTTGIVRPYSRKAIEDSLRCALDVAAACGVCRPVLVPGHIGAKAARSHFTLQDEQLIEVGNEWGCVLDLLRGPLTLPSPARGEGIKHPFTALLVAGHPGKLAKLAVGDWDTHSARSRGALGALDCVCGATLGRPAPQSTTAEGVFAALEPGERKRLADALAARIRAAVSHRVGRTLPAAVFLINMAGEALGSDGDLSPWR